MPLHMVWQGHGPRARLWRGLMLWGLGLNSLIQDHDATKVTSYWLRVKVKARLGMWFGCPIGPGFLCEWVFLCQIIKVSLCGLQGHGLGLSGGLGGLVMGLGALKFWFTRVLIWCAFLHFEKMRWKEKNVENLAKSFFLPIWNVWGAIFGPIHFKWEF